MTCHGVLLLFLAPSILTAQIPPDSITGYEQAGPAVTVRAGPSAVRFRLYAPDILRVDFLTVAGSAGESSLVVIRGPSSRTLTVVENDSTLAIVSSSLRIVCTKRPFRILYQDAAGRPLVREPGDGGLSRRGEGRMARFSIPSDHHFYGTGERGTSLDMRGQALRSYNTQVGGYSEPLATMNLNVPFLASTGGFALYFENTHEGRFDIGASDSTLLSYEASGGDLSYYLIVAPTIPLQLERYTWLTGKQPLPPRWAFGYIQSKNRYPDEPTARSIVQTLRAKGFPCDAIVLDLKWFKEMGDLSWDTAAWKSPDAMMADFQAAGVRTILITEPYIVDRSANFPEAVRSGFLARDSAGHPYLLDRWWSCDGCRAGLLDMTNPAARRWWWSLHPPFLGRYVAGLWTDLGEPERHPAGMHHSLGTAPKVHNLYNLLWAKTVYEGMQTLRPGARVFNLTRSGYAGIQRYGVLPWSGDVARSFGGLAVQLPMLLNMGMSGLAYQNSDIGGYARNPTTPELYVRWMQFGTFSPIARAHGAGEDVRGSPTEPWRFGPDAERICREFITLRYKLLPYIYTLAHENWSSGMPLARPLFFADRDDPALANESSSYLWGEAFLVSPVVHQGQTSKKVYLPAGEWIDFWTDSLHQGKRTVAVETPLDRMPLFVRGGSIIPMAPPMLFSDERPLDTLTLAVYPSLNGEASYTLYEDDGKTLAYQNGSFSKTSYRLRTPRGGDVNRVEIEIGPPLGVFDGKSPRRVYVIDMHRVARAPSAIMKDSRAVPGRSGLADLRRHDLGYWYDAPAQRLFIQVQGPADNTTRIVIVGPPR
jgi:alpha-glucosidase (family GH31 glycosyl hydrolase)